MMRNKIKKILKEYVGDSIWPMIYNVFYMVLSLFTTSAIARYLGTEEYGLINYVLSTVTLFTTFSTLGMDLYIVKDIVDESSEYNKEKIVGTSILIRFIGSLFLIVLSQITLHIISRNNQMAYIIGFIVGISMIFKSIDVIEYYMHAKKQIKYSSILKIVTLFFVTIYKILIIKLNLGIIGYALSYVFEAIVFGLLLTIWFKSWDKNKFSLSKQYGRYLLKRCWYSAVAGILVTLYNRIDQVMLGSMLKTTYETGIYSAAIKISEMWYFIPLAFVASYKPLIMEQKKKDSIKYKEMLQKLYNIIAIVGVFCCVMIFLFSKIIVSIIYGQEYITAASVLSISVWSGVFASFGSARSIWLISEGYQKYTIYYTLFGAILNIILNYILIPTYGAFGAALTTLITQFFTHIIFLMFFKKTRSSSFMIIKSLLKNEIVLLMFKKKKNNIS